MTTAAQDPAPETSDVVLDPQWLGTALGLSVAQADEMSVDIVETILGTATKYRLELSHPALREHARHVCVKGALDRPWLSGEEGRASEARFYDRFHAEPPLAMPDSIYRGVDPATGNGVIIMTDLKRAGADFLDVHHAVGPDAVAAALDQLAAFHATTRGDRALLASEWLQPHHDMLTRYIDVETLQQHMDSEQSAPVSLRDAARIRAALGAVTSLEPSWGPCLAHGDAHIGNVFQWSPSRCGWADWQVVHVGSWAVDVAYVIATGLSTEVRRRHEADLVEHYRIAAGRADALVPSPDEAWLDYRRGLAYGFYLWAITRGIEAETRRPMVSRLGCAVEDHETFALLGV